MSSDIIDRQNKLPQNHPLGQKDETVLKMVFKIKQDYYLSEIEL